MRPILLFLLVYLILSPDAHATRITGAVTDDKGNVLPYSSILVKGTTHGVTAGQEGKYILDLSPGEYTLVCQYVGYARQEKKITVGQQAQTVDFRLALQQLSMAEVVVRPGGEDPAYEIIRHAIKKRKEYEEPLDSFTCEAYNKALIRTRKIPDKIFGQKIQQKDKKEMGVDSVGKGIIFLSESLTKIAFKRPGKLKLEVLSGRESGSNGYGFSVPIFINFYNNNVTVLSDKLNPRGFVSPIAESALNYYRYKYLGSFFEDGREINQIQVIPRRKFEPLFAGTINIVEGDWRIHSLDLTLLRQSQLEILDTLEIRQIHAPIEDPNAPDANAAGNSRTRGASRSVWQVRNQVVYFTFNILGIEAVGNFLNVYNNYDIAPRFHKRFFNNVLIHFDTAGNKKTQQYWDSIRPVPLQPEELNNFTVRDSVYKYNRDSLRQNGDTFPGRHGPVKALEVLSSGFSRTSRGAHPLRYSMQPLLPNVEYNTVEGINASLIGSLTLPLKKNGSELSLSPNIRYGFHNTHLNAWATLAFSKKARVWESDGPVSPSSWALSGGKRVSQFNPDDPISEYLNGLYTLFLRRNYMKIYEKAFADLSYTTRMDNGLRVKVNAAYEDRMPLDNTSGYSVIHIKDREFTPNYPFEQLSQQFPRHQAVLTGISLQYQPGQRYIEYPRHKIAMGSKYPTFTLDYQKGWQNILGSDVNFDKWQFSVRDDANFKLKGLFRYRFSIGGFLNDRSVFIQDYQHFNGNQTLFASQYLNSFQLAPYYANSTTAPLYATGHIEHHFNGLLTNKIPLFRRLNWHLVGGSNAFYVNQNNNYVEVFGGLENIFKLFRVDLVGSYLNGHNGQFGVRIGLGGLLGGNIQVKK